MDGKVFATSRRAELLRAPGWFHLDLAEPASQWPELPACNYAVICAAVTSLAECEKQPEYTHRINVDAVGVLAARFATNGTYTVFLSTSQVFDGNKSHPSPHARPSPSNIYGAQKAAAEEAFLNSGAPGAILRLGKVLIPPVGLFEGWAAKLRGNYEIAAFDDMWLAPVSPAATVEAIVRLLERRANGIFQLTAPDQISYLRAAQQLATHFSASIGRVAAGSAHDAGLGYLAPANVTLDTHSLTAALSIQPARSQVVLAEYFDTFATN